MSNKNSGIVGPLWITIFMACCIGVGIATSDREFVTNASPAKPAAAGLNNSAAPVATAVVVADGITYTYHVTLLKQPNDNALIRCVTMRATGAGGQTFTPVMNCK